MQRRTRTILIASAAAVTAALAYFAPEPSEERISTSVRGEARAPQAVEGSAGAAAAPAALPERAAIGRPRGELFAPRSWEPPAPPPKVEAQAAPPPAAPPLPYKYAGKLVREGEAQLFLAKGDVVFPVVKGETLDGSYKVEAVAPDEITLIYLPLGTRERIPVLSALGNDDPIAKSAAAGPAPVAQAAASAPSVVANSPASRALLRWEGPERVRAGNSFDVALRVTTEQPLRASPMQLRYDAQALEPVNVRPGKFFAASDGSFSYRVNPDGTIFVGVSGRGAGAASDAELLVMTFKPVKPGATAEVNIASLSLQGATGRSIAHTQPGSYRATISQ